MKNHSQKKILSFTIIYEEAPEGGYVVSVPALPGCHTQGDSIEEAESNIKEAISLYLESLENHKEKVTKEPRILQGFIDLALYL